MSQYSGTSRDLHVVGALKCRNMCTLNRGKNTVPVTWLVNNALLAASEGCNAPPHFLSQQADCINV